MKKASVLSKEIIPELFSANEVSDIVESFHKKTDEILSWASKGNNKSDILLKNEMSRKPTSQKIVTVSNQSQPSYVEDVVCHTNTDTTETNITSDVTHVMGFILDKIDIEGDIKHRGECNITADVADVMSIMLDKVVAKASVEGEIGAERLNRNKPSKSQYFDDFGIYDDVTPVSVRNVHGERFASLKCRRSIDLSGMGADQDLKQCRLIVDELLDRVSSTCKKLDETGMNADREDLVQSLPDFALKEKGPVGSCTLATKLDNVDELSKMMKQNILDSGIGLFSSDDILKRSAVEKSDELQSPEEIEPVVNRPTSALQMDSLDGKLL